MIKNEQEITIYCVCGEKETMKFLHGSSPVVASSLPIGWREIAGLHICPKHNIQVFMDEEVIYSQGTWKEGS